MKNRRKRTAFLAALLLPSVLLTGCGVSGSNTGAWIAIIVMVFIAVFAATSGVVYLVLQKVLPPEEEQPRTARPVQHRTEDIDDVGRRPLLRPTAQASQTAARNRSGEWICPRDHTRNTGPYCAACGDSRPQRQVTSQPARTAQPAEQNRSYLEARYASQSRQEYSAGTTQTRTANTAAPTGTVRPHTQTTAYTETAQPHIQPAAPQQEQVYTGKFARKEPQTTSAQETDLLSEPEYDAELLAAIFREAERDDSGE